MQMSSSPSVGKRYVLLLKALPVPLVGFPLWIVLSNVYSAVFALHNDRLDAVYLLVQIGAVYAGMIYLACVGTMWIVKSARITWKDLGFAAYRVDVWSVLWFVLSLLYLVTFSAFWQILCTYWHISLLNRSSLLTSYTSMPFSQASMILIIGIIGPLGEEVLFRGLLFRRLDELLTRYLGYALAPSKASLIGLIGAVSISAGVFAGLHPDPNSFPVYFVIGVVLALWMKYTRSLWPGWVLHMAFNSLFIIPLIVR
jgi:membrane protease YdiL (CAAX protease family)